MKNKQGLDSLFNPGSIAVVGASDNPARVGSIVFNYLLSSGKSIYPVNPGLDRIEDRKVFPSILDIPAEIDLAVIAVSAQPAVEAAEECGRKGVPFVIVIASGFGETGDEGSALEDRLREVPKHFNTRILGPNSLGIFMPENRIDTIFVEHGDKALAGGGSIAFITQSGSVGVESLGHASNIGFGMRAFVGLGNKIDLNECDFIDYFKRDRPTNCLAFYLENIECGRTFLREAAKVTPEKPVIVLKAGRTGAGASAVASHTGRLAGSDQVINGAFRQYGIQRAADDEALCDAAKTLSMLKAPAGNRVAVITPAGGYGVMLADYIESSRGVSRLEMAMLEDITKDRIREASFPFASCRNPVDLTAGATNEMFGSSIDTVLADPNVDIVICVAFFGPPTLDEGLIEEIASRAVTAVKPIIVFTQYGPFTNNFLKKFYEAGVVGFPSIGRCVRAAGSLVERTAILKSPPPETEVEYGGGKNRAYSFIPGWFSGLQEDSSPDEHEAKQLLDSAGIAVPAGVKITADQDIINVSKSLPFPPPYILKVCSPRVLHKTEQNGVLLNINRDGLTDGLADLRSRFPGENILIEEMIRWYGQEFIIGALVDPSLGPALMVGAGGIFTEIYRDIVFRLAPCSKEEAFRMLGELGVSPVLEGFRGLQIDKEGLAGIVSAVGDLVVQLGNRFSQLDINPIVFDGERWTALDAKLIINKS
jgi:acetate---CoA ligase (ADP-forming)